MAYGLGIDTGGTYTDGAVVDFASKHVLWSAKSLTTRHDLSEGISRVIAGIPPELKDKVGVVSLSTTLATNACVEGKGCRTALILLGYDERLFGRLKEEYGLQGVDVVRFLDGRHGQRGQVESVPDWDAFRSVCREVSRGVDAIGIAEYWGLRNPEFEMAARDIAREETGLPVAAAHELSAEVNSLRRAATAALNAQLIPLIDQLLRAVRLSLDKNAISAPMMIVRGDGSLMSEAFARERPVETLLSGPAASVMGGLALADEKDAVVVDIGGTTTDIAIVREGRTVLSRDGVEVGAWTTGTRAISIRTIGLGGDSLIGFDKMARMTIGPRKAVPLAQIGQVSASVETALEEMIEEGVSRTYSRGEFFSLVRRPDDMAILGNEQIAVLDALEGGPLSVDQLAAAVGTKAYFLDMSRLEYLGAVIRCALTPTDIWHVMGQISLFHGRAASLGLRLMAQRLEMSEDDLCERVTQGMGERVYRTVASFLFERALKRGGFDGEQMLGLGYHGSGDEIACDVVCKMPLVGIGAPTHVVLPLAARALHTRDVTPPYAGVANAVGAISGSVLAEEAVTIKPHFEITGVTGFSAHSSGGFVKTKTLDDALAWAREEASRAAGETALAMGAREIEITLEEAGHSARPRGENAQSMLLEMTVVARAMGKAAFE